MKIYIVNETKKTKWCIFNMKIFGKNDLLAKISTGGSVHVSKRQIFLHGNVLLITMNCLCQHYYFYIKINIYSVSNTCIKKIFKFHVLDFLFYLCKLQFICRLLLVYGVFFLVNLNIQQKRGKVIMSVRFF